MQVPRPAATVALVRDRADGIETYLLERNSRLEFAAGATVFPGGAVDDTDHDPVMFDVADPADEETLSRLLGSPPGASGYWFAAIRECFEEVGVLLAAAADDDATMHDPDRRHAYRVALLHDEATMLDACRSLGAVLAVRSLRYLGQWITPPRAPRRYDTRFFVAPMPRGQDPDPDRGELVSGCWWTPADALAAGDEGELDLILPTERALKAMGVHRSVADLLAALDRAGSPPVLVDDSGGHRVHLPDLDEETRA